VTSAVFTFFGGALLLSEGLDLFSNLGITEHGRDIPMLVTMGRIRFLMGLLAILSGALLLWLPRLHVAWGTIVLVVGLVRVLRLEAWFANLLGAGPIVIGAVCYPLEGCIALGPMFYSQTPLFAEGLVPMTAVFLLFAGGILAVVAGSLRKIRPLDPPTTRDRSPSSLERSSSGLIGQNQPRSRK